MLELIIVLCVVLFVCLIILLFFCDLGPIVKIPAKFILSGQTTQEIYSIKRTYIQDTSKLKGRNNQELIHVQLNPT